MTGKASASDQVFLNRQRERLLKLQAEISSATEAEELEETGMRDQSLGEAHEFEEDAQRLSLLDLDGTLVGQNIQRLRMIARAREN
jgi:hypothetical protein